MKKKKNILLLIMSILGTLAVTEVALRLTGTKPGTVSSWEGMNFADSLVIYKNFTTDEAGIYKFSPWVTDSLLKYFDCNTRQVVNPEIKNALPEAEKIYYIYESFCKQTGTPVYSKYWSEWEHAIQEADSNCLRNTHERILRNTAPADSGWRAAFEDYYHRPFNTEGFRSMAFQNHSSKQLKVFIIGDSFVYGMDALPFQNSFVDLLLTRGYLVYAAGVPGTDPSQYAAIAQKYIPLIKPDVVISCFYTGNDFMRFEREPAPYKPTEYYTNAGLISAEPYGKHLDVNQAYHFYKSLCTFPDSNARWFDKCCARSAIGTVLWNSLYNKGLVHHAPNEFYGNQNNVASDTMNARTKIYTQRMVNICVHDSVAFIQAVIPEKDAPTGTAALSFLFNGNYYLPLNMNSQTDYVTYKDHFNNTGAFKFASFLDSLLQPLVTQKERRLK